MRSIFSLLILFTCFFNFTQANENNNRQYEIKKILQVDINSSINPATANYIKSAAEKSLKDKYQAILIAINTPGGLVSTTKDIITELGKTHLPIIIWVYPEAGSATSAGAIISSSAHVLFMSSGSNIGAAAPVMMGKDIDQNKPKKNTKDKDAKEKGLTDASDMKKKAVNDLVSLVQSLSEARDRNPTPFIQMVTDAKSFTAKEAKDLEIIKAIVNNRSDLIKELENTKIKLNKETLNLSIAPHVQVDKYDMDPGQKLLNIFANPMLAYILFLVGAALIYLELQAPGGLIAGSIGAVCLLLAGISFQVLPLNFGALGLIILSFILFVLEVYVTSFGLISVAGIASLLFGSLFLFRGSGGSVYIPPSVIYSSVGAIACFLALMAFFWISTRRKKSDDMQYDLIGKIAEVIEMKGDDVKVKVNGEIWPAEKNKNQFNIGDKVKVTGQSSNMSLTIENQES